MLKETAAFVFAALLVTGNVSAADPVRETRPIANISELALKGSGDVSITQGDKEDLVVEAQKALLPKIITEVSGGRLTLSQKSGFFHFGKEENVKFYLTVKKLDRIALSGSGDIHAGSLTADKLEIATSGSGNVRIGALTAQEVETRIGGSSDVKLAGKVVNQRIRISGSGDYGAGDLQSAVANISVAGSGDALLWATDSLSVAIAGSGDVKYYGGPKVSQSVAGSGDVRALGNKP